MHVKYSRGAQIKRILMIVIIGAGTLLCASYFLWAEATPARSFTTKDLLITLEDMPPDWIVSYGPGRAEDYISGNDASTIRFTADPNFRLGGAAHSVYRYGSRDKARGVYEELVLPGEVGEKPVAWTYTSRIADQFHFACYDYEGRQTPICSWSGRYEEYIVLFHAWLVPGRMSLSDIERIVNVIDQKMTKYLGK